MNYRIINNSIGNHCDEVKQLFSSSTDILIASPFITIEAINAIQNSLPKQLGSIALVTTMKPKDGDQQQKVPVLLDFYSKLKNRTSSLNVYVDNSLHGKIYIGRNGKRFLGAIISSANFTGNGLSRNHEWGVIIDDPKEIQKMHNQIMKDQERAIDQVTLVNMEKWMQKNKLPVQHKPQNDLNILEIVSPSHSKKGAVTYWLKPYGTLKSPVIDVEKFDTDPFRVTFAKGVNNIKEGDILIVYAVGSRKILSLFVATNDHGKLKSFAHPEEQRWPYYVTSDNLTPLYGAKWASLDITLDDLKDAFLNQNPQKEVRPGSQNFEVMKRGLDRLKLTREFAEFVIEAVLKQNK
jgi:HKD family nuclease